VKSILAAKIKLTIVFGSLIKCKNGKNIKSPFLKVKVMAL